MGAQRTGQQGIYEILKIKQAKGNRIEIIK
jgi:hypothetical protein